MFQDWAGYREIGHPLLIATIRLPEIHQRLDRAKTAIHLALLPAIAGYAN
jgi:hypothetical protein